MVERHSIAGRALALLRAQVPHYNFYLIVMSKNFSPGPPGETPAERWRRRESENKRQKTERENKVETKDNRRPASSSNSGGGFFYKLGRAVTNARHPVKALKHNYREGEREGMSGKKKSVSVGKPQKSHGDKKKSKNGKGTGSGTVVHVHVNGTGGNGGSNKKKRRSAGGGGGGGSRSDGPNTDDFMSYFENGPDVGDFRF